MRGLIYATLITGSLYLLVCFIKSTNEETEKRNITTNSYVVRSLGQCTKSECAIGYSINNSSDIIYGTVSTPVNLGQLVYRTCWTENKRGNMCYTRLEVKP